MGKDGSDKTALGDRLKGYESAYETRIQKRDHIVVRIDGHKFSKFTKGFRKPYDEIMTETMKRTTMDLVERFSAYTGYTQSDEITLFIPSLALLNEEKAERIGYKDMVKQDIGHIFDGRVQKLASLTASYASIRFNYWFSVIIDEFEEDEEDKVYSQEEIDMYSQKVCDAYFDARVYGTHEDDVVNSFLWRVRDCVKNSKSMFAQTYCSHKDLQNKSGDEQIKFCEETTGEKWDILPSKFKYGTFVKRMAFQSIFKNEYGSGQVLRTKVVSFPGKNFTFNELKDFILEKTISETKLANLVPDKKTFVAIVATPSIVESYKKEGGKLYNMDKIIDKILEKTVKDLTKGETEK